MPDTLNSHAPESSFLSNTDQYHMKSNVEIYKIPEVTSVVSSHPTPVHDDSYTVCRTMDYPSYYGYSSQGTKTTIADITRPVNIDVQKYVMEVNDIRRKRMEKTSRNRATRALLIAVLVLILAITCIIGVGLLIWNRNALF